MVEVVWNDVGERQVWNGYIHRLGVGAALKGECRERLSGGSCMKVNRFGLGVRSMVLGGSGVPRPVVSGI